MATSAKKSAVPTAPMLKKPPRHGKVPCRVCQGPVVDGKDEALLCEAKCGLWLHRGCASVPPSLYKELSSSEEPFVCLTCTNLHLKREIQLLKNELRGMVQVRDRCTALDNGVSSLKQTLDSLAKEMPLSSKPAAVRQPKRSYARAVRTVYPSSSQPAADTCTAPSVEAQQVQKPGDTNGNNESGVPRPKIKVNGARRIWNTLPTCSAKAIATTISKLVPAKLDLRVKCKTKKLANSGKTIWWFVVHGTEGDLTTLEQDWDKVQHQTLWSLQHCFMSSNNSSEVHLTTSASTNSLPNPMIPSSEQRGSPTLTVNKTDQCVQPANSQNAPLSPRHSLELPESPANPPLQSPFLDRDLNLPPHQ